jgi:steroid delta-isomerase-like uncharacterized protein
MTIEQDQQVVRRLFQTLVTGDTSVVDQIFDPNWTNHDPTLPPMHGREGAVALIHTMHDGMSDSQVTVDDIFSVEDKVVTRFTFATTHTGPFMGIPATNKRANVTGMGIFRVVNGKLTDNWVQFDALGMLQQLGIVPAMQPHS